MFFQIYAIRMQLGTHPHKCKINFVTVNILIAKISDEIKVALYFLTLDDWRAKVVCVYD